MSVAEQEESQAKFKGAFLSALEPLEVLRAPENGVVFPELS